MNGMHVCAHVVCSPSFSVDLSIHSACQTGTKLIRSTLTKGGSKGGGGSQSEEMKFLSGVNGQWDENLVIMMFGFMPKTAYLSTT